MATIIPTPGEGVCFTNETTGVEYCWDGDKWVSQGGGVGGDINLPPDLTDALNQEIVDRTQGDLDVRTDLKNDYQPQIDAIESGGSGGGATVLNDLEDVEISGLRVRPAGPSAEGSASAYNWAKYIHQWETVTAGQIGLMKTSDEYMHLVLPEIDDKGLDTCKAMFTSIASPGSVVRLQGHVAGQEVDEVATVSWVTFVGFVAKIHFEATPKYLQLLGELGEDTPNVELKFGPISAEEWDELDEKPDGDKDLFLGYDSDKALWVPKVVEGGAGGGGPDLTDELAQEVQDRKDGDREVRNDLKSDYQTQIDQLKATPPGSMPEPPANQGAHGRETNAYGFSSWVKVPSNDDVILKTGGELTGGIEVKGMGKGDKILFNDYFSIEGKGAIFTKPEEVTDEFQVPNLGTVLALIAANNKLQEDGEASTSKYGKIGAGLVYKFMNQGGNPNDGIVHGSSYDLKPNSDLYFSFNPNGYNPGKDNIPFFRHEQIAPGTIVHQASLINNERYDLTMGIYEPQWEGPKPSKSTPTEDYNRTKSPANWIGTTDIKSIEFTYYGIKVRTGKQPNIYYNGLTTGRLYRFVIPGFM